jgi:hypothetical protein
LKKLKDLKERNVIKNKNDIPKRKNVVVSSPINKKLKKLWIEKIIASKKRYWLVSIIESLFLRDNPDSSMPQYETCSYKCRKILLIGQIFKLLLKYPIKKRGYIPCLLRKPDQRQ